MIQIESIGLAVAEESSLQPLPWRPEQLSRPAIDFGLSGHARWNALAQKALSRCLGTARAPSALILASSNGGAQSIAAADWMNAFDTKSLLTNTPWQGQTHPVVSTSCASGAHALHIAELALSHGLDEVLVLAVDVLTPASIENFRSLRVLSSTHSPPWQEGAEGFVPGEAAVALRVRAPSSSKAGYLLGVRATTDLGLGDGLARVLGETTWAATQVLGQGSGPAAVNDAELRGLAQAVAAETALSTPSYSLGHTVGVSSILGLSMLASGMEVYVPSGTASDGRRVASALPGLPTISICRALSSQVVLLGSEVTAPTKAAWIEPQATPPLSIPALRELVESASANRPSKAPEALHVHFEYPLLPLQRSIIGGRVLPSTVLELSPGYAATQIARVWGYTGASTASVGNCELRSSPSFAGLLDKALVVYVLGDGNRRRIIWPGESAR